MTIDELIKRADWRQSYVQSNSDKSGMNINQEIEHIKAYSLLAIAKSMNSKICLDCEGTGFGKPTEAGKNTHGLTIRKETHCPTCKGRGRVE